VKAFNEKVTCIMLTELLGSAEYSVMVNKFLNLY
jgi:hypothetical protein